MAEYTELLQDGHYEDAVSLLQENQRYEFKSITSIKPDSSAMLHYTYIFVLKIKTGKEGKLSKYLTYSDKDKKTSAAAYDNLLLCR